jgi:hypothetical protein
VSKLEPLVAAPHSPDNRKLARECSDVKIDRVYIGSCTVRCAAPAAGDSHAGRVPCCQGRAAGRQGRRRRGRGRGHGRCLPAQLRLVHASRAPPARGAGVDPSHAPASHALRPPRLLLASHLPPTCQAATCCSPAPLPT